jgi:hypothetical protein
MTLAVTVSGSITLTSFTITGNSSRYPLNINPSSATNVSIGSITGDFVRWANCSVSGAAAPINLNAMCDMGGNTGITFTYNRYWVGGSGNWSQAGGNHWAKTSGGSADQIAPNLNDNAIFDVNSFTSGSKTVTSDTTGFVCKSINFTDAITNAVFTGTTNAISVYGDLTFNASLSGNVNITFTGNGDSVIRMNGCDYAGVITMTKTSSSAKVDQADDFNATGTQGSIQFRTGVWNTNNHDINAKYLASSTGTATFNMGSSQVKGISQLDFTGGTTTINAQTSTFVVGGNINISFKTGTTINNLYVLSGFTGTMVNPFVCNDVKLGAAGLLLITAGRTLTLNSLTSLSSSGTKATLRSATSGSKAYVSSNSPLVITNYWNIKDLTAQGTAVWFAGSGSVDQGNNTNWSFTSPTTFRPKIIII